MAIGLASAIGLQRKSNVLEGLGESVSKVGSQIVAAAEQAKEKKKLEDEKKADAAYDQINRLTNVTAQVEGQYDDPVFKKKGVDAVAEIKELWNQGASKQKIQERGLSLYADLMDTKTKMEKHLSDLVSVADFKKKSDETKEFNLEESEDFAAHPAKYVDDQNLKNEIGDKTFGQLTTEQRLKVAPRGFFTEYKDRAVPNIGDIEKAKKDLFGQTYNLDDLIYGQTVKNASGVDVFSIKENQGAISKDMGEFLSSYQDYRSSKKPELIRYWAGLENNAKRIAQQTYPDDIEKQNKFVADSVIKKGTEDYERLLQTRRDQIHQEYVDKTPIRGGGAGSEDEKKAQIAEIKTEMPPDLVNRNLKMIEGYKEKLKELNKDLERNKKNNRTEAIKINERTIKKTEDLIKQAESQKYVSKDYIIFSTKPTVDDPTLIMEDENGKQYTNFRPSYVYKKDGKEYIGGTIPKLDKEGNPIAGEGEAVAFPYNETNYRKLFINRRSIIDELNKTGKYTRWDEKSSGTKEKTWAERQAEKRNKK